MQESRIIAAVRSFLAIFLLFSAWTSAEQCPGPPIGPFHNTLALNEPLLINAVMVENAQEAIKYHWWLVDASGKSIPAKPVRYSPVMALPFFRLVTPVLQPGKTYTLRVDRSRLCARYNRTNLMRRWRSSCAFGVDDKSKIKYTGLTIAEMPAGSARWKFENITILHGMMSSSKFRLLASSGTDIAGIPILAILEDRNPDFYHTQQTASVAYGGMNNGLAEELLFRGGVCGNDAGLDFGRNYFLHLYHMKLDGPKPIAEWSFGVRAPPGVSSQDMRIMREYFRLPFNPKPYTPEAIRHNQIVSDKAVFGHYQQCSSGRFEFSAEQLSVKAVEPPQ